MQRHWLSPGMPVQVRPLSPSGGVILEQKNFNKLRTVALRILPAFTVAFAMIITLAAPAGASGFDFKDYLISVDGGSYVSSIPTAYAHWNLCGYPSMEWMDDADNPAYFTLDPFPVDTDFAYALVCDPFGSYGLDVTNIPNGSELSFEFDVDIDQPEDSYTDVDCHLHVKYYSADDVLLSTETFNEGAGFYLDSFVFDDFVVNKPAGADHMIITFYFLGFELVNYSVGSAVVFTLDNIQLTLAGDYIVTSTGNIDISDYSGSLDIFTQDSINFPCQVYVAKDALWFTNADSDVVSFTYLFGGTGTFVGVNLGPNEPELRYPVGSLFTMYEEGSLYLVTQGNITGNVTVYNHAGTNKLFELNDVVFPCKVNVVADGLTFTYFGSSAVNYHYVYDGRVPFVGVSTAPLFGKYEYAIGDSFYLFSDDSLYLILESNIYDFDIDDPIQGDGEDIINGALDLDSSSVNDFFVKLLLRFDFSFAEVFTLFWTSELLHNILLMASLFALFSFILFGKKG